MSMLYEILSTPAAYGIKWFRHTYRIGPGTSRTTVNFGEAPLQRWILWEPAVVTHEAPIIFFHGGAYLLGKPEAMENIAALFLSRGYRFCSMGFRLMPGDRFPAQTEDAFIGTKKFIDWMKANGRPCSKVIVGGNSAGGHASAILTYDRDRRRDYSLEDVKIIGCISGAGVTDADDMLLKPFPNYGSWKHFIDPSIIDEGSVSEGLKGGAGDLRDTWKERAHQALKPYSPIELIDENSDVPYFAMHGKADTESPYSSQVRFVNKLNRLAGEGTARLFTLGWKWQHIMLTVGLYEERIDESPCLRELFRWLDYIEQRQ